MLENSVFLSLGLQIITGLIDALALQFTVPKRYEILKDLLRLELFVQIVEGIFYTWLAFSIKSVENITPYRYVDWFITTPTMLITFVTLLIYINRKENMEDITLIDVIKKHRKQLASIIILNALMLLFGLLGEFGILNNAIAVLIGFIPFIVYYYIIYINFVLDETSRKLFLFFFITWSLYGVFALMPYKLKNIGYNFLDLFSKNLFGIILSYMVFIRSQ